MIDLTIVCEHMNLLPKETTEKIDYEEEETSYSSKIPSHNIIFDNPNSEKNIVFLRPKSKNPFLILFTISVVILVIISAILAAMLVYIRNDQLNREENIKSIAIDSIPENADIYINNLKAGVTPVVLTIDLSSPVKVLLKKDNIEKAILITKDDPQSFYKITLVTYDLVSPTPSQTNTIIPTVTTTPTQNISAPPTNTTQSSNSKHIQWTDYGLNLNIENEFIESSADVKTLCQNVKQFLISSCTDNQIISYKQRVLSNYINGVSTIIKFKMPEPQDLCSTTNTKCTKDDTRKIDNIAFLGQNIDVYQSVKNSIIFTEPNIKISGLNYSGLYIEFNNPSYDYKSFLNSITKL